MRILHLNVLTAATLLLAVAARAAEPVPYDVYALGVCDVDRVEDLAVVHGLGFNCVEVFYSKLTPEYLAEAQRLGLKVIPFLFPGDAANHIDAAAIDALNLGQHRDAPISAWFPIDEPSGGRVPEELCVETYQMVKQRDPDRAIFTILNYSDQTSDFKGSYDILGLDPYPIVYGGEWGGRLAMVANDIETARRHDQTNPIWMVIQSFGNIDGWERMPTAAELVTMAGLGFVSGSEGTLYYPWDNRGHTYHTMNMFPQTLAEVQRLNRAVAEAAPALARPALDVRFREDPAFVRLLVAADGHAYLFVVNGDYGARTITVESPGFDGASLLNGSQDVAMAGRQVRLTFTDCGVMFAKLRLPAVPESMDLTAVSDPPQPRVVALNQIARVEAAELDPSSIYSAASIGDDSFITNWCSPRPYTLPFPVDVTFHQPRPVSQITIHPLIIDGSGYDAWKDVRVTTSDGQVREATFGKKDLPYIFEFTGEPIRSFKVEVLTTHDHRNYLGIREIEVQ